MWFLTHFAGNYAIPIGLAVLSALALPVFIAGIAGTTVSGKNAWVKDYYGVALFTATLPMTTARLVAAKFKAAVPSMLITWAVVAGILLLAYVVGRHLETNAELVAADFAGMQCSSNWAASQPL